MHTRTVATTPALAPAPRAPGAPAHPATPGRHPEDALVDAEGEQSFPASDPPSWTLGVQ